jgi:uncharacterized iron-regulated membrane protein
MRWMSRRFRGRIAAVNPWGSPGVRIAALSIAIGLLSPATCLAYVDPNAGGWLFQLLFPLIVAVGGVWALFKAGIHRVFDRLRRRPKERE